MQMVSSQNDAPRRPGGIGQQVHELLMSAPAVHAELAARVGVGVTDLLALDYTTSAPSELGVVELGNLLKIRSASATVLVDRLVARGHLERAPHSTDGRRTSLHPTASAHRDVRAALEPLIQDIAAITDELSESETEVVMRVLGRISAALGDFVDSPSGARMSEQDPDRDADRQDRDDDAVAPPEQRA